MPLPVFRAAGAKAAGTTSAVVAALPSGMSANDIVILVASTNPGATISITNAGSVGTWNAIGNVDVTGGERIYAWWGRWSSGTTGVSVQASADHICAGTAAWSGVNTGTDVIRNYATGTETTSDTSFSFAPGTSTDYVDSLCIAICSINRDSNTGSVPVMANTSLTSLASRLNYNTLNGGGGGFGLSQGAKATPGTMGTWTATLLAASPKSYMSFALNPPYRALSLNGTPNQTFTLTGVASLRKMTMVAGAGSFALAGQDAGAIKVKSMPADAGTFVLTGQNATLIDSYHIDPEPGAFVLTGNDATLTVTGNVVTHEASANDTSVASNIQYTTQDSDVPANDNYNLHIGYSWDKHDFYVGGKFVAGASYTLSRITARLRRESADSSSHQLTARIYSDNAGMPGYAISTVSSPLAVSTLPIYTWVDAVFVGIEASLVSGRTYHLVINTDRTANGEGANHIDWACEYELNAGFITESADGVTWVNYTWDDHLRPGFKAQSETNTANATAIRLASGSDTNLSGEGAPFLIREEFEGIGKPAGWMGYGGARQYEGNTSQQDLPIKIGSESGRKFLSSRFTSADSYRTTHIGVFIERYRLWETGINFRLSIWSNWLGRPGKKLIETGWRDLETMQGSYPDWWSASCEIDLVSGTDYHIVVEAESVGNDDKCARWSSTTGTGSVYRSSDGVTWTQETTSYIPNIRLSGKHIRWCSDENPLAGDKSVNLGSDLGNVPYSPGSDAFFETSDFSPLSDAWLYCRIRPRVEWTGDRYYSGGALEYNAVIFKTAAGADLCSFHPDGYNWAANKNHIWTAANGAQLSAGWNSRYNSNVRHLWLHWKANGTCELFISDSSTRPTVDGSGENTDTVVSIGGGAGSAVRVLFHTAFAAKGLAYDSIRVSAAEIGDNGAVKQPSATRVVEASASDTSISSESTDLVIGLMAHWRMDDTSGTTFPVDSSGNNRHLQSVGDNTSVAGKVGNALYLNGSWYLFRLAEGAMSLSGTDWTVSMWVKPTAVWSSGPSVGLLFKDGQIRIGFGSENKVYATILYGGGSSDSIGGSSFDSTLQVGVWQHIVFRLSGTQFSAACDGQILAAHTIGSVDSVLSQFIIGTADGWTGFNGAFDEVSKYNVALTDTQIGSLYNGSVGRDPTATKPIAHAHRTMSAAGGSFTLSGQDALLCRHRIIRCMHATYSPGTIWRDVLSGNTAYVHATGYSTVEGGADLRTGQYFGPSAPTKPKKITRIAAAFQVIGGTETPCSIRIYNGDLSVLHGESAAHSPSFVRLTTEVVGWHMVEFPFPQGVEIPSASWAFRFECEQGADNHIYGWHTGDPTITDSYSFRPTPAQPFYGGTDQLKFALWEDLSDTKLRKSYVLSAGTGAFALTGIDAELTKSGITNRTLTADTVAFTETGIAAALKKSSILSAAKNDFVLTGVQSLRRMTMVSTKGTFALSGIAAASNRKFLATKGTFTLTGIAATPKRIITLTAAAGSFVETGQAVNFLRGLRLTAAVGTFVETGIAASKLQTYRVTSATGGFVLSGKDATLAKGQRAPSDKGTFLLTGIASNGKRSLRLAADKGTFALTGIAAIPKRVLTLTSAKGTFVETGVSANLLAARRGTSDKGTFTLTGISAGLNGSRFLVSNKGTFVLSGVASLRRLTMVAAKGTFTLSGIAAARRLAVLANHGSFALSLQNATLSRPNRVLTAAKTDFALNGVASTAKRALRLTADKGTFVETGVAANLVKSRRLAADKGTFVLSGVAAASNRRFLAVTRAYTLTGQSASKLQAYRLSTSPAAFVLSGKDVSFGSTGKLSANHGTFVLTGQPSLRRMTMVAAKGTFTLSGVAAASNRKVAANTRAFVLTGIAAVKRQTYRLPADKGTFSLTGYTAGEQFLQRLTAAKGTFTLTGQSAGRLNGYALPAVKGTFLLSGISSLRRITMVAQKGTFTFTTVPATLRLSKSFAADKGTFLLTGQSSTAKRSLRLTANTGTFLLTGQPAALNYGGNTVMPASAGSFVLSGQDTRGLRSIRMISSVGTFVLSGQASSGSYSQTLQGAKGTFSLTGQSASKVRTYRFVADAGSFVLNGSNAVLARHRFLPAAPAAFVLNGIASTSRKNYLLGASKGTFSSTYFDAILTHHQINQILDANKGYYYVYGYAAQLKITPAHIPGSPKEMRSRPMKGRPTGPTPYKVDEKELIKMLESFLEVMDP